MAAIVQRLGEPNLERRRLDRQTMGLVASPDTQNKRRGRNVWYAREQTGAREGRSAHRIALFTQVVDEECPKATFHGHPPPKSGSAMHFPQFWYATKLPQLRLNMQVCCKSSWHCSAKTKAEFGADNNWRRSTFLRETRSEILPRSHCPPTRSGSKRMFSQHW